MLSSRRAVLLYTAVIGAAACSEFPPTAAPPIGVPPPAPDAAMLGRPLPRLSAAQRAQFEAGRSVFATVFTPATGLGPLFNADSCVECHENPAIGGVGDEIEIQATRFIPPDTCDPLFQEGGNVIQQKATPLLQAKGVQKEQIPPHATAQAQRTSPRLAMPDRPEWETF